MLLVSAVQLFGQQTQDTTKTDTLKPYEPSFRPDFTPQYRFGDPFANPESRTPFSLQDPSRLDLNVQFNTDSTSEDAGVSYGLQENLGNLDFRPSTFMSFDQYDSYTDSQLNKEYFKERSAGLDGESAVSGRSLIPRLYISPVFDRIFGGSYVDIQPNGFVNLDFGGRFQRTENPEIPLRQQRNGGFNFDQQISLNVVGKVGEKLSVTANFDNNNTFDFQNNLKIEYTGYEEDIIQKIEVGNVSMPVSNSLITGAQSLFGLKTELKFGKLYVTSIFSQQRGKSETLTIESGFQGQEFEIQGSDYDENRHFFLGHFFRNNYEKWLATLPQVTSGVNVTRVEVYVLNRNNDTETTRNIVSLLDLGEGTVINKPNDPLIGGGNGGTTRNGANSLYSAMINISEKTPDGVRAVLESSTLETSTDYNVITTARKLDDTEFTINKELGYISLSRRLQSDEILAVSYEYTFNGQKYQVGELTENYQSRTDQEVIFLKMLRPNRILTDAPSWDLMMKNIYNLNASSIGQEGFQLRVHYRDDNTGQDNPSLHEGQNLANIPLVEVFGLDRLNQNNDRQPDGNFDFIPPYTIDTRNGNIIFPVLEPFGSTLANRFEPDEGNLASKYVYEDLYASPKIDAVQNTTKDKFVLLGILTAGSSSKIALPGINIAEGSVVLTAGNTQLVPGQDYTVNYTLGEVTILNEGILQSGKTITVAYEKADLFNFQMRTLTGTRLDYQFDENFNIGGTVLHLNERPGGISRYAIGNEPTSNTKYGFDVNFQKESRFLTKMVDALPLISTKAPSNVSFNAEFAQLIPGTSNVVDGEGTSYIDDFESAITPINIGGWQSWILSSVPEGLANANLTPLSINDRRAKLAWYTVDNGIFYSSVRNTRPDNITEDDLENNYERPIFPQEIFRQRDLNQINLNEPIFDVAFFPQERGPYNYNPNVEVVDGYSSGKLPGDSRKSWAGITRPITNEVNFNQNNIEYLEFWLMDPFIDGPNGRVLDGINDANNTTGGQLYFNLGNISEDIAPDGKHAFENGLPTDGAPVDPFDLSTWGRITTDQFLNRFFNAGAITSQDIGIDGLADNEESEILSFNAINSPTLEQFDDVSGDNFRYVIDDFYDERNAKIVERYKDWNGMDGNSRGAVGNTQEFVPSSSANPDNEDINQDNTISDLEEYFEYNVDLARYKDNLSGNPFVVDEIASGNGESTWYLFRIPIKNAASGVVGSPRLEDIKYIRTYLTGWAQPVVLRFANMRLVGSQWRKYEQALFEEGLNELPNTETSDFFVSAVNVEENSRYVLPPGIERDIDNSTTLNRRFNEQSLQICVEDLEDKDARAVFKNVNLDMVNYGRMKMFLHAEQYLEDNSLQDDQIKAFLRFGTDNEGQYYEIEVPLKITDFDQVGGSSDQVRRQVWPLENEIDVSIKEIIGIKAERNRQNLNPNVRYTVPSNDGRYEFTVLGNPDISAIKTLMIGVRNPGDEITSPKSICLWANELRVSDFDTNAGWAGNARLSTQLADFARVSASTRYTSIGFGSIQQRISERTRAETTQYDVSANVNVEKLLKPEKTGLVVPMFVSYDKSISKPQFDPLDPDVPLEASLEAFDSEEERDEYRRIVEDRTTRRSLNFTNVRKQKVNPDAPNRVFDIENFSFSYAYSDRTTSNATTYLLFDKTQSGGFNYNYSPINVTLEPFKSSESLGSPYLALIKDFNFSPLPSNFSFSTNLRRNYKETTYYTDDLEPDLANTRYERLFTFARTYGLRWDITKSLNFTYNATANAVIDEPDTVVSGDINTRSEKTFIWDQILSLGRMKNFKQDMTVNYKLPLDKIPFTDWLSADAKYAITYGWVAGAINNTNLNNEVADSLFFGNVINNGRNISVSPRADLEKVYDKLTPLKNAKSAQGGFGNGLLNFFMMLKSVNATYAIAETTSLPGFLPKPFLLGLDSSFNAPGWSFVLGNQDPGIRNRAAENGWLTNNPNLNTPFQQSYGTDLDISATIEPLKDLNIQLTWNKALNNRYQEIFRDTTDNGQNDFVTLTPSRTGSYSISYNIIGTSFEPNRDDNFSQAFADFEQNLLYVQDELARRNPFINQNNISYDTISQDVLIPSFLAAYGGRAINQFDLTPVPKIPLPNWRVDYAGLSKIPALAEAFSSITLSHGYNSTYTISSFTNSLNYGEDEIGLQNDFMDYPYAQEFAVEGIPDSSRLVPVYVINQVVLSEQFVPLIGVNIRTKNNISTRIEYKKSRNLTLNMSNAQVTETANNEFTFDLGYAVTGFKLPWRFQGRTITLENDLRMQLTASVRDSKTVQRKIFDENGATITNGNTTIQFRPNLTYKINNQLDLTAYFERSITDPKILSSYRRTTSSFGIQLRFSLSQ